jgi:hypothetical protein
MAAAADTPAGQWLKTVMKPDDVKLLVTKLDNHGITSKMDLLRLSHKDLEEMQIPIGPRNRFWEKLQKLYAESDADTSDHDVPSTQVTPQKPVPTAPKFALTHRGGAR